MVVYDVLVQATSNFNRCPDSELDLIYFQHEQIYKCLLT
jgi:hypothetical protein